MHADEAAIKKSVRQYLMVFGALLVLTVVTVAVSRLELGVEMAVAVALAIATVKGSMVASVFMHLSHEKKLIYGVLILTVVFAIGLIGGLQSSGGQQTKQQLILEAYNWVSTPSLTLQLRNVGSAAIDLAARRLPALDRPGQILAKPAVEVIVVVAHLEAGFGKKVGKIFLEVLVDPDETGSRFGFSRRFASLH